jgi:hypothetical protein
MTGDCGEDDVSAENRFSFQRDEQPNCFVTNDENQCFRLTTTGAHQSTKKQRQRQYNNEDVRLLLSTVLQRGVLTLPQRSSRCDGWRSRVLCERKSKLCERSSFFHVFVDPVCRLLFQLLE